MNANRAQVLLVDDDPSTRTLLTAVLERQGWIPDVACDGEQALQKLRKGRYRAILLDLLMPRINGFEVLHALRAQQPEILPNVIVLTAASDHTLRDFPDTGRICSLLRKPFDNAELLRLVDGCLSREVGERSPAAASRASS